ncbi:MAG: hypothetical protein IT237_13955 [Bacteroidia bacterium]|nr:hypothetical protein [Bacteroidia bacterium]
MKLRDENIFVQIPSYKDTQLVPTIESMFSNAYNSARLKISVCWQHDKSEKLPQEIHENKNIHIIDIDYRDSKGANWARNILQKNWNKEPYSFFTPLLVLRTATCSGFANNNEY